MSFHARLVVLLAVPVVAFLIPLNSVWHSASDGFALVGLSLDWNISLTSGAYKGFFVDLYELFKKSTLGLVRVGVGGWRSVYRLQDIIDEEVSRIQAASDFRAEIRPQPRRAPSDFSFPIAHANITQRYGPTWKTGFRNPVYRFHNGIDLVPSGKKFVGTPVRPIAEGIIIAAGNTGSRAYGKWVAVEHAHGLVSLYGHLSSVNAKINKRVSSRDTLGYMGATGFSTGPHVHLAMYLPKTFWVIQKWFGSIPAGKTVNPLEYLHI